MAETSISISDDLTSELSDVGVELERIEKLSTSVGKTLSSSLRSALTDGKSFRTVLSDIAETLTDVTLKAAFKPIETLTSSLIQSLFAATDTSLAGAAGFAKGGIVSAPTYFALGSGLGVAGEAGAEAVLPLSRGSDGRLGVASNASAPISISMNITTADAKSFTGAEAELSAMFLRAVRRGTRAS